LKLSSPQKKGVQFNSSKTSSIRSPKKEQYLKLLKSIKVNIFEVPSDLYYITKLCRALKNERFENSSGFVDHFSLNCQSILYMAKQRKLHKYEMVNKMVELPHTENGRS